VENVSVILRSGCEYDIIVPYYRRGHLHYTVTKTWWDR